jgi:hypothetical protein
MVWLPHTSQTHAGVGFDMTPQRMTAVVSQQTPAVDWQRSTCCSTTYPCNSQLLLGWRHRQTAAGLSNALDQEQMKEQGRTLQKSCHVTDTQWKEGSNTALVLAVLGLRLGS